MNASASTRKKLWRALPLAVSAVALGGFGVESVEAQCMYEIVAEIENPTCEQGGLGATAINDHNVVVGFYFPGCGFDRRPFIWSEEAGLVLIPLPPGVTEAQATDVNNNGEIVGFLGHGANPDQAFHWKDGIWTELPSLPGFPIMRAHAINDSGIIVGEAFDPNAGGDPFRAVMWSKGGITELRLPLGPNAYAFDINEQSFAAGLMGDGLFGESAGFIHHNEVTIEIPPLRGTMSAEAIAINDQNVATGQSIVPVKTGSVPRRSWIFESSMVTDLGVLPEADHRTVAQAINEGQQIVGRSTELNGPSRPFLWQHGQIHDLQALIVNPPPGFNLNTANAINNNGWITVDRFVLRPVDRPLGDVNIDCVVDERDLIAVLEDWGPDKSNHPTDQVTSATFQPPGDGVVDGADLAVVLGNWSTSSSNSASEPRRR